MSVRKREWTTRSGERREAWIVDYAVNGSRGGLELPLKMVQERLGHATLAMTADRYGHLFPSGDDGAELAKAEKLFFA